MHTQRLQRLRPEFVDAVPDAELMEDGVLYVSMVYATAIHKCACGCGLETVTPFSPVGWSLTFNGEGIWLTPSIGNWGLDCKSHYWIRDCRIIWASARKYRRLSSFFRRMRKRFDRCSAVVRNLLIS